MFNRADAVDNAFTRRVLAGDLPSPGACDLRDDEMVDLFDTMLMNRHLDLLARRSKGQTFYSIGSSGHEVSAIVAKAARPDDMAFLHYRDACFVITRRKAIAGSRPLYDMMLSFAASREDPVSGGRHKVLGGLDIYVPPQTSTIASHLPKAMGFAHAIGLTRRMDVQGEVPRDALSLCSFGDASANHSTAQGAINAAAWASYQGAPMPAVFICEDNGVGISVDTPRGWIAACYQNRPGLDYVFADGTDPLASFGVIKSALDRARRTRKPLFLHLSTVRLMGHAGADIEASYRDLRRIEDNEARDPLLASAAHIMARAGVSAPEIVARYEAMRARVARVATRAFTRPKLETAKQVMAPIIPPTSAWKPPVSWPELAPAKAEPVTLARSITSALSDILAAYPMALIMGEDVGKKGGVYGVTQGLQKQAGPARVFDTLLDEQTILGTAIGAAQNGFLPIPEIQFLAYLHNAADQIRGEAATLSYFSDGQFTNPMVVRIAGLAYQRGFGGHFHNDNGIAAIRDIPGLIVACPSNAADAGPMLREAVRLAYEERRVVIFIEPIALYQTADLHQDGDKAWLFPYSREADIKFGQIAQHGDGDELAILTYGNGYYLSRQAAAKMGRKTRIIDLRWLSPLPIEAVINAVKGCQNILIVDECREMGGPSEELLARLYAGGVRATMARHCAMDSFIPLGPAAYAVLPSAASIIAAADKLCAGAS